MVQASFAYKLDPEVPGLARRLGELYVLTAFYRDALKCFEHAVKLGDKDVEVIEKIALCREIVAAEDEDSFEEPH